MKQVDVKVMKLHPEAVIPRYANRGDAGFDLCAIEDVIVQPGETVKVRTGLAFAVPEGYELQIRPRSGISLKTKLRVSNSPGTVDSGYRGEVCILVDNVARQAWHIQDAQIVPKEANQVLTVQNEVRATEQAYPEGTYLIQKGDRIAQGVIAAVPQARLETVTELDETERGAGGFGSSGVK